MAIAFVANLESKPQYLTFFALYFAGVRVPALLFLYVLSWACVLCALFWGGGGWLCPSVWPFLWRPQSLVVRVGPAVGRLHH